MVCMVLEDEDHDRERLVYCSGRMGRLGEKAVQSVVSGSRPGIDVSDQWMSVELAWGLMVVQVDRMLV